MYDDDRPPSDRWFWILMAVLGVCLALVVLLIPDLIELILGK